MKIVGIIGISFMCFVLLVLAVLILIGVGSFHLTLSPKAVVKKIAKKTTKLNRESYGIDHSWWDKQKCETLSIQSFDGLTLFGHLIECQKSNNLAIVVHGYGGNYKDMNCYADMFLKRGYSVLVVECRAHGKSQGDMIGMGWLDRLDIQAWVRFMLERNQSYKIGLFGQSMGASAVCMALGEKLPNNVICAIADCGFDNVYRQMYYVIHKRLKFLAKPVLNIFNSYMKRTRNYDLKRADAVMQLKKSHIPVLFIHGKNDDFVPIEMSYHMYETLPETRRDILVVDGAEHIMSYATDSKAYTKKVYNFLNKYNM